MSTPASRKAADLATARCGNKPAPPIWRPEPVAQGLDRGFQVASKT